MTPTAYLTIAEEEVQSIGEEEFTNGYGRLQQDSKIESIEFIEVNIEVKMSIRKTERQTEWFTKWSRFW